MLNFSCKIAFAAACACISMHAFLLHSHILYIWLIFQLMVEHSKCILPLSIIGLSFRYFANFQAMRAATWMSYNVMSLNLNNLHLFSLTLKELRSLRFSVQVELYCQYGIHSYKFLLLYDWLRGLIPPTRIWRWFCHFWVELIQCVYPVIISIMKLLILPFWRILQRTIGLGCCSFEFFSTVPALGLFLWKVHLFHILSSLIHIMNTDSEMPKWVNLDPSVNEKSKF